MLKPVATRVVCKLLTFVKLFFDNHFILVILKPLKLFKVEFELKLIKLVRYSCKALFKSSYLLINYSGLVFLFQTCNKLLFTNSVQNVYLLKLLGSLKNIC